MSNMPALVVVSQKSWLIRADFLMFIYACMRMLLKSVSWTECFSASYALRVRIESAARLPAEESGFHHAREK